MKCAIQWIDADGRKTPDTNDAVILVWVEAHYSADLERLGAVNCYVEASDKFPCCAEHAKRLRDPGMHYWASKPLPADYEVPTL